ncbi:MAG: RecQ family ATP-dependent DNA helicase [Bacteroidaceae bacterium]|nr:RecQ family ATP-dependent DNA helicase [Bacteroidaceae bacterium]
MNRETALGILQQYWGHESFRGIQEDIILSISEGHDTLGLMPTGGGKSITFQVPALAMEGVCLVVTPLIALMKDQVNNLRQRGIRAAAIYSGLAHDEILKILENAVFGAYNFLYVSPERLSSELFQTKLKRMHISFITIDEAHCISQWGYDFRPSYLAISEIRKVLPSIPLLALTATATERVVADICKQLNFKEDAQVFRMSFARANLRYIVRTTEDKTSELIHILNSVEGSAIVYTRSRRGTKEVCATLNEAGIPALFYHAGLTNVEKDVRQREWQEGATRVMVATNAFGMGIDKADVRVVIHMNLPDSIEAYFQEAGRAGRDGKKAYAVLLYNRHDHGIMLRRIPETFPDKEYIRKVYDSVAYFLQMAMGDGLDVTREFNLEKFCINFKYFPVPVLSALGILTRAGYIEYREEEDNKSRLLFIVGRDELYRLHHLNKNSEEVIRAILRNYGGVFSNYVTIEEDLLAGNCNLSSHEVYEILKLLNHQRIIHYIPHKNTPYITYTRSRIESRHIILSPEVYDDRKKEYEERVEAILHYAGDTTTCRSKMLLHYFGDSSATDCGQCDVCLARKNLDTKDSCTRLMEHFRQILSDGKGHRPEEFSYDGYSSEVRKEAIECLTENGELLLRDGFFFKE